MRTVRTTKFLLCLCVLVATKPTIAQSFWTKTDWNCASTSIYESAELKRVVFRALKHAPEQTKIPDRAFAFDLNGDKRPEYFVPLTCGATGNCDWAIFSLTPDRFLGFLNGEYLYLRKQHGRWSDIYAYGHLNAAEGVLNVFRYRSGHYSRAKKSIAIGDGLHDPEIQSSKGIVLPEKFERANKMCEEVGN